MRIGLICGLATPSCAAIVDAFAEGGFRVVASSGVGMALARAGRIVEPIDLLTRESSVLGGRVEGLHPRVTLALATRWAQPKEREAAQSKVAGAIDVLVCALPQSPQDLGCSTQRESREALASGPWVAQAALMDLAVINHQVVLVLVPGDDSTHHIRALRHDMCSAEQRQELAAKAWHHLHGFRALQAWAFGWTTAPASALASDANLRRSGDHALPGPAGARRAGDSGAHEAEPVPVVAPLRVSGASEPHVPSARRATSAAISPVVVEAPAPPENAVDAVVLGPDEVAAAPLGGGSWPALPPAGRARVEVPDAFGAHWTIDHAAHLEPAIRATLHAALRVLAVVEGPAVILAHGGAASVVVRVLTTSTRAILRALATDPRALDNGVLVVRGEVDLTTQRVLNDSQGVDRLAVIALTQGDPQVRAALQTVPTRSIVEVTQVAATATHTLVTDPDGVWLQPRREPLDRAAIEQVARAQAAEMLGVSGFLDATELGVALLHTLQGSSAIAVNGEMALAICGGQAHTSDAVQIVAAKARKQASKAVIVCDAGPLDAPLLQGLKAAGFAALCLVPRLDTVQPEPVSGSLPILNIPSR